MQMETGLSRMINEKIKVVYIGDDDPLALRNGKTYIARILQKGWLGVVDESGEEYAYPPELFTEVK
nr:MAG TPA: hypothetical protein [Caudoviricetes sp.]DAM92287.1 MAG TPA: hypothetical protein [Caudoviricetes sp.]DAU90469.1 MAG TPA: hypothetical protein [Caudoviricetes sp.]DAZ43039.1 MAG TPA: hypothetical protein [Caudoviricetes sp.]